jgi:large subunit ribosomal protein L10
MREEKKYLVEEVVNYLSRSDYLYVVSFDRLSVGNVAQLRKALKRDDAEYHVVKNSVLQAAIREVNLQGIPEDVFNGTTAIVFGGINPSGVAKVLDSFICDPEQEGKISIKRGWLSGRTLSSKDVTALSKLPSLGELQAQFLSLLQTPMRQFLMVCNGVSQSFVRLLVAYGKK